MRIDRFDARLAFLIVLITAALMFFLDRPQLWTLLLQVLGGVK